MELAPVAQSAEHQFCKVAILVQIQVGAYARSSSAEQDSYKVLAGGSIPSGRTRTYFP